MIKLQNSLPNTITVEGRDYLIKTDFKYWLVFDELIRNDVTLADLTFLFEDEVPPCDFSNELIAFFTNPNSTPNSKGSHDTVIDYQEDGEFIYASFLQAYGIDLLETNMHWHKFKALVIGLPKDTIMSEIMGYRGYHKDNRKFEKIQEEQKRVWTLPHETDKEILEELDELFYNA